MSGRRRAAVLLAHVAFVAGCASIGVGVSVPIGRVGGITIGGSIPLPRPAPGPAPAASEPEAAASAPN